MPPGVEDASRFGLRPLPAESTTGPFTEPLHPLLCRDGLSLDLLEHRVNFVLEPAEGSGQDLQVADEAQDQDQEESQCCEPQGQADGERHERRIAASLTQTDGEGLAAFGLLQRPEELLVVLQQEVEGDQVIHGQWRTRPVPLG